MTTDVLAMANGIRLAALVSLAAIDLQCSATPL